jgi:hypothetical protein
MSDIIPTPTLDPDSLFDADLPTPVINESRMLRIKLLKNSDWTQTLDAPLSDAKKVEWATYRQALRDLPSSENPSEFPQPPSA